MSPPKKLNTRVFRYKRLRPSESRFDRRCHKCLSKRYGSTAQARKAKVKK